MKAGLPKEAVIKRRKTIKPKTPPPELLEYYDKTPSLSSSDEVSSVKTGEEIGCTHGGMHDAAHEKKWRLIEKKQQEL